MKKLLLLLCIMILSATALIMYVSPAIMCNCVRMTIDSYGWLKKVQFTNVCNETYVVTRVWAHGNNCESGDDTGFLDIPPGLTKLWSDISVLDPNQICDPEVGYECESWANIQKSGGVATSTRTPTQAERECSVAKNKCLKTSSNKSSCYDKYNECLRTWKQPAPIPSIAGNWKNGSRFWILSQYGGNLKGQMNDGFTAYVLTGNYDPASKAFIGTAKATDRLKKCVDTVNVKIFISNSSQIQVHVINATNKCIGYKDKNEVWTKTTEATPPAPDLPVVPIGGNWKYKSDDKLIWTITQQGNQVTGQMPTTKFNHTLTAAWDGQAGIYRGTITRTDFATGCTPKISVYITLGSDNKLKIDAWASIDADGKCAITDYKNPFIGVKTDKAASTCPDFSGYWKNTTDNRVWTITGKGPQITFNLSSGDPAYSFSAAWDQAAGTYTGTGTRTTAGCTSKMNVSVRRFDDTSITITVTGGDGACGTSGFRQVFSCNKTTGLSSCPAVIGSWENKKLKASAFIIQEGTEISGRITTSSYTDSFFASWSEETKTFQGKVVRIMSFGAGNIESITIQAVTKPKSKTPEIPVKLTISAGGLIGYYGKYNLSGYSESNAFTRSKSQASTASEAGLQGSWKQTNEDSTWTILQQGMQLLARQRVPEYDHYIVAVNQGGTYSGFLIRMNRNSGCLIVVPSTIRFLNSTSAQFSIMKYSVTAELLKNCREITNTTRTGTWDWTR